LCDWIASRWIVTAGPAELYVDADGHESNRVRIWVEP
jgi:hypothetical protein